MSIQTRYPFSLLEGMIYILFYIYSHYKPERLLIASGISHQFETVSQTVKIKHLFLFIIYTKRWSINESTSPKTRFKSISLYSSSFINEDNSPSIKRNDWLQTYINFLRITIWIWQHYSIKKLFFKTYTRYIVFVLINVVVFP